MIKLENVVHTEDWIKSEGYGIANNLLESVDVNVVAHFGNCCCLELMCSDICIISSYSNTINIGYLLKALVKLLKLEREDGMRISKIKHIPIRLVFDTQNVTIGSKVVGFGHFMEDRFVLTEDFVKIDG